MSYKAQFALEYFQKREEQKDDSLGVEDLMSSGLASLGNAGAAALDAMNDAGKAIMNFGKSMFSWMSGSKKPDKVKADEVFNMEADL